MFNFCTNNCKSQQEPNFKLTVPAFISVDVDMVTDENQSYVGIGIGKGARASQSCPSSIAAPPPASESSGSGVRRANQIFSRENSLNIEDFYDDDDYEDEGFIQIEVDESESELNFNENDSNCNSQTQEAPEVSPSPTEDIHAAATSTHTISACSMNQDPMNDNEIFGIGTLPEDDVLEQQGAGSDNALFKKTLHQNELIVNPPTPTEAEVLLAKISEQRRQLNGQFPHNVPAACVSALSLAVPWLVDVDVKEKGNEDIQLFPLNNMQLENAVYNMDAENNEFPSDLLHQSVKIFKTDSNFDSDAEMKPKPKPKPTDDSISNCGHVVDIVQPICTYGQFRELERLGIFENGNEDDGSCERIEPVGNMEDLKTGVGIRKTGEMAGTFEYSQAKENEQENYTNLAHGETTEENDGNSKAYETTEENEHDTKSNWESIEDNGGVHLNEAENFETNDSAKSDENEALNGNYLNSETEENSQNLDQDKDRENNEAENLKTGENTTENEASETAGNNEENEALKTGEIKEVIEAPGTGENTKEIEAPETGENTGKNEAPKTEENLENFLRSETPQENSIHSKTENNIEESSKNVNYEESTEENGENIEASEISIHETPENSTNSDILVNIENNPEITQEVNVNTETDQAILQNPEEFESNNVIENMEANYINTDRNMSDTDNVRETPVDFQSTGYIEEADESVTKIEKDNENDNENENETDEIHVAKTRSRRLTTSLSNEGGDGPLKYLGISKPPKVIKYPHRLNKAALARQSFARDKIRTFSERHSMKNVKNEEELLDLQQQQQHQDLSSSSSTKTMSPLLPPAPPGNLSKIPIARVHGHYKRSRKTSQQQQERQELYSHTINSVRSFKLPLTSSSRNSAAHGTVAEMTSSESVHHTIFALPPNNLSDSGLAQYDYSYDYYVRVEKSGPAQIQMMAMEDTWVEIPCHKSNSGLVSSPINQRRTSNETICPQISQIRGEQSPASPGSESYTLLFSQTTNNDDGEREVIEGSEIPIYGSDFKTGRVQDARDKILREIADTVQFRHKAEGQYSKLNHRAKDLQEKVKEKKDFISRGQEFWHKKYIAQLPQTESVEKACSMLRAELCSVHRRLLVHLEEGELTPLTKYKLTSTKLQYEINKLRHRVDLAKLKLNSKIKLEELIGRKEHLAEEKIRRMRNDTSNEKLVVCVTLG